MWMGCIIQCSKGGRGGGRKVVLDLLRSQQSINTQGHSIDLSVSKREIKGGTLPRYLVPPVIEPHRFALRAGPPTRCAVISRGFSDEPGSWQPGTT